LKIEEKRHIHKFTWVISPYLHKEIEDHLDTINNGLSKNIPKQRWIRNAITEKLKRPEPKNNKFERISIIINPLLSLRLNYRVKKIREKLGHYSKRQFFIEAILEKLQTDEESIKKKISQERQLLNDLKNALT
jgi:hypothetical protein